MKICNARRHRQCKASDNTPIKSHLRKFIKIRYISNWTDFFGKSNLKLTKKKSLREFPANANVANSARCKASRTLGIQDFKFACFLTINSVKDNLLILRYQEVIFISESGIEQVLKRRKIVIPQSHTFDHRSTCKLLLIVATGFLC